VVLLSCCSIRLACPSTIDAVVTARAEKKRTLANEIVDEGRMQDPKFDAKEMMDMLS
jgi:hypothetical protein